MIVLMSIWMGLAYLLGFIAAVGVTVSAKAGSAFVKSAKDLESKLKTHLDLKTTTSEDLSTKLSPLLENLATSGEKLTTELTSKLKTFIQSLPSEQN